MHNNNNNPIDGNISMLKAITVINKQFITLIIRVLQI